MMFDRFDYYEAATCVAHDYGCYRWFDAITHGRQFTPRPTLTTENLTEHGADLYDAMIARGWHVEAGEWCSPRAWPEYP